MKKEKSFFALFILCLPIALCSQNNYYWIKFKDKPNSNYFISHPSLYLSSASIERRQKQNIAVNETDLPVSQNYIDSISPYILSLKHRLKWFNMVVVQLPDSSYADSIRQFLFVDTLNRIEVSPARSASDENKFEEVTPVNQQYIYPNEYGIAYRQTNMMNVDLLHQTGARGQGIVVSVMDNGFLNVNTIKGFDSVRHHILYTWDFVHNQENVYGDGGHGTSTFSCMAANIPGQILGTAPDASYYLLQTEENNKEWVMEEYNWAAAAEWADSAGAQIFSTSLGYTNFDGGIGSHTYNDLDGHTTIIARAGNMAFGKGILVLNSAGNEGGVAWHYVSTPADGDSILAVGAVDSAERIAAFSGRGPTVTGRIKPDICAQGVLSGVLTTLGETGYSNGTSFSCPIMAGSAASLWSAFPDKSARDISTAIVVSCPTFWQPDNNYGSGIPNFYTAYWLLKTDYNDRILQVTDDVLLYPNPFSSDLNISLYGGDRDKKHLIQLFDMSGREMLRKEVFLRDHTFEVLSYSETKNLAAGKYVLRLDGNKSYNHVVIKAK